ncbi:phospholipase A2 [Daphnia magna]|uniref:phospholipase A2 n=1 Tax=Daphnia magna TaxID=35525 RepID=UPI001E1BC4C0|nr:phospholipase A2 [Daphnia magna]
MKLIVVLSLLKITFATTSNWTNFNELLIFDGNPCGRRAVLVSGDPNEPCHIYGQNNHIQFIENLPDRPTIRMINQQEWSAVLDECQKQLLAANPTSNPVDIHFIYPGTKWCGPGNVANAFDDLGTHVATDTCCRDHDNCGDKMNPGACKNGLCNNSIFTKSNCQCDEQLRHCLLNSNDEASFPVGLIYFNVAAITCYQQTPDCLNKDFRQRQRKHFRNSDENADPESGWCFIRPLPFRKSKNEFRSL